MIIHCGLPSPWRYKPTEQPSEQTMFIGQTWGITCPGQTNCGEDGCGGSPRMVMLRDHTTEGLASKKSKLTNQVKYSGGSVPVYLTDFFLPDYSDFLLGTHNPG